MDNYPFLNEYSILSCTDFLCLDRAALYLIDMNQFANDEVLVTSCPGFLERLVGLIFFFKSIDFFALNLHVISCIQLFFFYRRGAKIICSLALLE